MDGDFRNNSNNEKITSLKAHKMAELIESSESLQKQILNDFDSVTNQFFLNF